MSGIFNRINLMISRYLSNRLLVREQGLLLGVMACMLTAGAFSSAFINTFLYRFATENAIMTDGIFFVARYNLYSAIYMLIFCCLAGILAKKITYKVSMTIGALVHVLFYVYVTSMGARVGEHIGLISMLSGLGTAFFYISYNSMVNVMIGSIPRKQYILFQSIISSAAGVILPVIAGGIIFLGGSMGGYIAVFVICAMLCAAAVILCFMLPRVRGQSRRTYFAAVLLKSLTSKRYFAISFCDVLRGLKDGIVIFLIPVVIIRLTSSALAVGAYIAMCALAGMLGNLALQKVNVGKFPYVSMLVSLIFQFAAALLLVFEINVAAVFVFGGVSSLLSPVFAASMHIEYYGVLTSVDGSLTKKTLETTCVKEIYFNLGKIISILILNIRISNTMFTTVLISVFFAMQVIAWIICVACHKLRK